MPNPSENWLLRAKADLTPALIAKAIARRLKKLGVDADTALRMDERIAVIEARERALAAPVAQPGDRIPWFCSGCPHNTSTRVPEGSRAVAGIGCHYMTVWMDRRTATFTQMGGEGVTWVGQAPFTNEGHIFANLGDGTYFHSGLLAIRQSIAAGVNITYKVLYNDAVAMTGGQRVGERPEGHSVLQIMQSLLAEGVARRVIVTDQPEKYAGAPLASGVGVHHRDDLDRIQRELREVKGCTAIIYDQTCATEKRRRRKRGTMADSPRRVVINELVCEGCGDCSEQSNCLSVEPVETEFGRKRRINQSTCNKDFSCVKGFCPSFVTIEGGQLRKPKPAARGDLSALPAPPEPTLPSAVSGWGIVVAGVGGTGVITIGQLLGMAAHLEGKAVVTQDAGGLAQKGGATWSHIQIAEPPGAIHTTKVDTAKADLVIACDAIVAAQKATLQVMQPGRTRVAMNTHGTPTAAFVHNPDWQFPTERLRGGFGCRGGHRRPRRVRRRGRGAGDAGRQPLHQPADAGLRVAVGPHPAGACGADAFHRAQRRAGGEANKAAFEWGRRCAHDLAAVQSADAGECGHAGADRAPACAGRIGGEARRVPHRLPGCRVCRTAMPRLRREGARGRERAGRGIPTPLLSAGRGPRPVQADGPQGRIRGGAAAQRSRVPRPDRRHVRGRLQVGAPPRAAADGPTQRPRASLVKSEFGPWMRRAMGLLPRLKGLRGTALDPFGRSAERRTERALIGQYRGLHRRAAAHAHRRTPEPGRRDRESARWHPRLRSRQGAAPGGNAAALGCTDAALARGRGLSHGASHPDSLARPARRASPRRAGAGAVSHRRWRAHARGGLGGARAPAGARALVGRTALERCRRDADGRRRGARAVFGTCNRELRAQGLIVAWRDESFAVPALDDTPPAGHLRARGVALLGHA
jgi:indolepyruvate ferredoxin oxidoreductase